MKNTGLRIGLVIFFVAVSIFYLYPSFRSYQLTQRMNSLQGEAREEFRQANFETMRGLQERTMKFGLDLQGGMHVTMEVRVEELLRALATDTDAAFDQALAAAVEASRTSDDGIVDLFVREFERNDPNARLSRYFRSDAFNITRRSSNGDVANYLRQQADAAVDRAIQIVRQRVDRFGVTEPSIVKQGSRRIVVELPGVDDAERVRRLLRGTARLEFRLMADPEALQRSLSEIIAFFEPEGNTQADTARTDTTGAATGDSAQVATADTSLDLTNLANETEEGSGNELLRVLTPIGQGVQFGVVNVRDTSKVNRLLSRPEVQAMLPSGVSLLYDARPSGPDRDQLVLLGVRDHVELTGEAITEASVDFDETNRAQVSMTMNSQGAQTWARVTGANINRPIGIVLDDYVVSYPNVINRITGGRSSITGLESRAEAQDIVTILQSGSLPAPVNIIEERVVGPSLGAASIRAGFLSLMIGLLIVSVFMTFYYRTAGLVAVLALLLNVFLLFGILAAFGATLTLPGIAGIVLTIGMAVDANVLIFERIREEMSAGKTLRASLEGGYSKALSAILDGNITTFFTGLILYSFGVGPIKGFAVTLMAGILTSLFCALVVTRLVIEYLAVERRAEVSVG